MIKIDNLSSTFLNNTSVSISKMGTHIRYLQHRKKNDFSSYTHKINFFLCRKQQFFEILKGMFSSDHIKLFFKRCKILVHYLSILVLFENKYNANSNLQLTTKLAILHYQPNNCKICM